MPRSKSNLMEMKKSIYERLNSEAVRAAFLECALNDEECTPDEYEEAKIMIKLSREHFGHPDPIQTTASKFDTDAEMTVPA